MSWSRPDRSSPPPTPPADQVYLDYGPPLPESYGATRVVALVRDPECLFAFWEGGDRIRARDLTEGSAREVIVQPTGTWYFGAKPEHEYEVDLLSGDRVVAVSDRVRMPRQGAATRVDEDWLPTPGQGEVLRALAVRLDLLRRGRAEGLHS